MQIISLNQADHRFKPSFFIWCYIFQEKKPADHKFKPGHKPDCSNMNFQIGSQGNRFALGIHELLVWFLWNPLPTGSPDIIIRCSLHTPPATCTYSTLMFFMQTKMISWFCWKIMFGCWCRSWHCCFVFVFAYVVNHYSCFCCCRCLTYGVCTCFCCGCCAAAHVWWDFFRCRFVLQLQPRCCLWDIDVCCLFPVFPYLFPQLHLGMHMSFPPQPPSTKPPPPPPGTPIPYFMKHRLPSTFSQRANLNPLVWLPVNAQIAHNRMLCCHINVIVFFGACICHSSGMWFCKCFFWCQYYIVLGCIYQMEHMLGVLRRPQNANWRCVLLLLFSKTMQGRILNCRHAHPLTHGWILKSCFFLKLPCCQVHSVKFYTFGGGGGGLISFHILEKSGRNHSRTMCEPCANHVRTVFSGIFGGVEDFWWCLCELEPFQPHLVENSLVQVALGANLEFSRVISTWNSKS